MNLIIDFIATFKFWKVANSLLKGVRLIFGFH